jgi:hypothetical protein
MEVKNIKRHWLSVYYMIIYSCLYEYQQHKGKMNTTYPTSLSDSQWSTIMYLQK